LRRWHSQRSQGLICPIVTGRTDGTAVHLRRRRSIPMRLSSSRKGEGDGEPMAGFLAGRTIAAIADLLRDRPGDEQ